LKIGVIIPAHNESQAIASVVSGVKARGLEPIVIDDGSQDNTGAIARDNGAVVLVNNPKQGKGMSLQRGFAFALEHGFDGVVTMDGDGQHSPDDLDKFLTAIKEHPQDVITGTRMHNAQGMPLIRLLTNRFMSAIISGICRQGIPDTQCGYRYISWAVLKDIRLTSRDFEIETEVLIKAGKRGYKIFSVPVQTIYRNEKSKINPFKDTIKFFIYLIRESLNSRG
jgi:glycosyltransferase involved in cell wall biosynthesis